MLRVSRVVEVSEGHSFFSTVELPGKSCYPRATILSNHKATENGLRSPATAREPPWWKCAVLSQLSAERPW